MKHCYEAGNAIPLVNTENEDMPEKVQPRLVRNMRLQAFLIYHCLFSVVFITNMGIFISYTIKGYHSQKIALVTVFLAFTLSFEQDNFKRIKMIHRPIEELAIERGKYVENILWLSNVHYIESHPSSTKCATDLITGLVVFFPTRLKPPASVLQLHIMPPAAINMVKQDLALPSHIIPGPSASETPHAAPSSSTTTTVQEEAIRGPAADFHNGLSTSPGAGLLGPGADFPETDILVKRRPY
ncbi:hypothetical protein ARMSODRAFT_1016584 [Armillaria solidipes]|uniref:Uncharacterized protein n=1 Tax=Armillaria solidipes TaxID=1076256 RepID=A0A2H3BX64_9AGAR|nr:hypothetical protein ARMSODRAFT_1016584 [Armillaria solidipes]